MNFFSRLLGFFSKDTEPVSESAPIGVGATSEVPDEMVRARDRLMFPIRDGRAEVPDEMVRARDEKGRYIADDPETEQDEAWVSRGKNARKTG